MRKLFIVSMVIFQAALGTSAPASGTQTVAVNVPGGKKLLVKAPIDWPCQINKPVSNSPPSVKIANARAQLSLQITFLPPVPGRPNTPETVDTAVKAANQRYLAGSVEKKMTLQRLSSKKGWGSYAVFTNAKLVGAKQLRPGQFRYATSGMFALKDQFAAFTLLTNSTNAPEYARALRLIDDGISASAKL